MANIFYETAPMPPTDGTNVVVNEDGKIDLGERVTTKLQHVDESDVYDNTKSDYAENQLVIYNNEVYKAKQSTTPTDSITNTTYWEKTSIGKELSALNSKLAKLSGVLGVTNSRYELNVPQAITAGTEYNIGTSPQLSNGTIIGIIIRNMSNITSIPIVYTGGNGTTVWARFSSNMSASTRKIIVDYIYIINQ